MLFRSDGDVYCWGENWYGRLGVGDTTDRLSPVQVTGGHKFTSIAAGRHHTCGLKADGTAFCWGQGKYGQLGVGVGDVTDRTSPVAVTGGHIFSSIVARGAHTCGLKDDGAAFCWGYNFYGQLGNNDTINDDPSLPGSTVPSAVYGGHQFASLHAGRNFNFALKADGSAYAWGVNGQGQLGNENPATKQYFPAASATGHEFKSISGGEDVTCGLKENGTAHCWGLNNKGQLGNGNTTDSLSPVAVTGGHTFKSLASNNLQTCGVTDEGKIFCWGGNPNGQLGNGNTTDSSSPVEVSVDHLSPGGPTFASIDSGGYHSCGLKASGVAYCWGRNDSGQLGNNSVLDSSVPTLVDGTNKFISLSLGRYHSCGLRKDGKVYCWGRND